MSKDFSVQIRLPNTIAQGDIIEVKAKIKHPSVTGLGLADQASNPYERFYRAQPAEFVRLVEVYYGDELVSKFELNSSSSNDPLIGFKLRADRQEAVRVVVTNHRRETVEASAQVEFS